VSFPLSAKILVTMIIMTLAVAMLGALAQVVVHDIIPTYREMKAESSAASNADQTAESAPTPGLSDNGDGRGDLFSRDVDVEDPDGGQALYEAEQFVWTLKWTHIHLFGMNMIFIFMGSIVVFLDLSSRTRAWLVGVPFAAVLVDIAAMWLKAYVSPHFFWLHVPGGCVFGTVFAYVSVRALLEMWLTRHSPIDGKSA
jgi:hypothetical protein